MDDWRQTVDQRLGAIEENLRAIRAAVLFRVPRDKDRAALRVQAETGSERAAEQRTR